MTNLPVTISIIAILLSSISLILSGYSIFRDRSKIKSWSYLFYDYVDKPSLRMIFVNKGRRPIYLKHISYKFNSGTTQSPFNNPGVSTNENNELIDIKPMLAHKSCIRLTEGETYEEIIKFDSWYRIINTQGDHVEYANSIWVEDVEGKKYKIKNAIKMYNEYLKHAEGS
jgi:hypothetical protein